MESILVVIDPATVVTERCQDVVRRLLQTTRSCGCADYNTWPIIFVGLPLDDRSLSSSEPQRYSSSGATAKHKDRS